MREPRAATTPFDPAELDPQVLASLDDDAFRALIDRSLRRSSDAAWRGPLVDPLVADRAHQVLTGMLFEVDTALTSRAAALEETRQACWARGRAGSDDWFAAQADYQQWRRRAVRAKQAILGRKRVAKEASRQAHRDQTRAAQRVPDRRAVAQLTLAIVAHRQASVAGGFDPEDHDRVLWQALAEVQVTSYGQQVPVGDLVEDGVWA